MEGENKEKLQQKDMHRPTKELYQRITEDVSNSEFPMHDVTRVFEIIIIPA